MKRAFARGVSKSERGRERETVVRFSRGARRRERVSRSRQGAWAWENFLTDEKKRERGLGGGGESIGRMGMIILFS